MIKIIETNLSIYKHDEDHTIKDHQSRVIEVDSWDEYVQEIKDAKTVVRNPVIGNLCGATIPHDSRIENLTYDEIHLDCDIITRFGHFTKKLAYKVC